jgi:IclR family transcriptional regulator, acetate operon repressor
MSTVDKTLKLLGYLKTTSPELGLSQFTRLSGDDKASTHRRLTELTRAGFLDQDPVTKAYRLGAALTRLALTREQSFPLAENARRVLERLYEEVAETVHVSIVQGEDGLGTLAHIDDRSHGNRVYIEPADVLPFHATASGIVTLAFAVPAFRDKILARRFDRLTSETETDPAVLALHLFHPGKVALDRRRGWRRSAPRPSGRRRAAIRSARRARPGASCPRARSSRPLPAPTMPRYRRGAASRSGSRLHPVEPARQTVSGWATGAQGPLPRPWPAAQRLPPFPRWPRSARP